MHNAFNPWIEDARSRSTIVPTATVSVFFVTEVFATLTGKMYKLLADCADCRLH